MLTFWGNRQRYCDGVNRRNFLQIGAFGAGLTLADMLRLKAAQDPAALPKTSQKSAIMIYLPGGPSHMDMYDLKPDAPADYRGEFNPIKTNVAGLDICELFPLQATIADRLALVRTVQFFEPMEHELEEVYTGFPKAARRPSFGAFVSVLKHYRPGELRAFGATYAARWRSQFLAAHRLPAAQ